MSVLTGRPLLSQVAERFPELGLDRPIVTVGSASIGLTNHRSLIASMLLSTYNRTKFIEAGLTNRNFTGDLSFVSNAYSRATRVRLSKALNRWVRRVVPYLATATIPVPHGDPLPFYEDISRSPGNLALARLLVPRSEGLRRYVRFLNHLIVNRIGANTLDIYIGEIEISGVVYYKISLQLHAGYAPNRAYAPFVFKSLDQIKQVILTLNRRFIECYMNSF